ncbi:hypothetical protein D3C84_943170 [compost metagenome]
MEIKARADNVARFNEVDLAGDRHGRFAIERWRGGMEPDATQFEGEQVEKIDLLLRFHRHLKIHRPQQHGCIASERRLVEGNGQVCEILQQTVNEFTLRRGELRSSAEGEIEVITRAFR